ncbi:MAG: ribonuclease H-like domain-containing protein [bacterium]|nr:ribonuclease H-like domain-containing protein [bacterium]
MDHGKAAIHRPTRVVLDIETIGCSWAAFSEQEQRYLTKRAAQRDDDTTAEDVLALAPLTGQVALIGMRNPDSGHAKLYFLVPPDPKNPDTLWRDAALCAQCEVQRVGDAMQCFDDEATLLRAFWDDLAHYAQIITFNGRSFDGPFVMLRSLIVGVVPSRNLAGPRYDDAHIDLADRLTFFGATRDRYTLDFWCRRLGIASPKEHMSGDQFERLWRAGALTQCCMYNLEDLRATTALADRYFATFGKIYRLRKNGEPGR